MAVSVSSEGAGRNTPGMRRLFGTTTQQLDNGTPVVSVIGDVDLATVPKLEQELLDATEDGKCGVIVDLTGCSFLDSRGLGALLATRGRLEDSNRSLALVLSNPSVMRIFEITEYDELFEIYPSLRVAVNGNGNGNGLG